MKRIECSDATIDAVERALADQKFSPADAVCAVVREARRARASEAALVKVARTAIARLKDIEADTYGEQVSPRVIALLEAAISKAEGSR